MGKCCGGAVPEVPAGDPCGGTACGSRRAGALPGPLAWFDSMLGHCLEHARERQAQGDPLVGILCEFTPREVILAAGGVPVCLCGGSAETIPAAEAHLPANLCPLIKSTYGFLVEGTNPFLEAADLVVAETTCDGKKKMYELMAARKPMHLLELPQKADSAAALDLWAGEVLRLREELERRFGTPITDDALRAAIRVMNRERGLRRALAGLMCAEAPPLTGRHLLALKSSISGIPADLEQYQAALDWLQGPAAPAFPGRVRVLLTGVPLPHGAERVLDLIEGAGGLVVCMENCTGLKPILEDIPEDAPDPWRAVAEKYFHLPCSVLTPNTGRLESIERLAGEYRADCVIELVWQACLTYDIESHWVRNLAEERLGLPYLRIETDYSPSDSARLSVRIEALLETVRGAEPAGAGRERA